MNSQRILTTSIICLLTICSLSQAVVQAQNSRAATAASYLEPGNEWMAKGEWDRAIDDYDLAIAFDSIEYPRLFNVRFWPSHSSYRRRS